MKTTQNTDGRFMRLFDYDNRAIDRAQVTSLLFKGETVESGVMIDKDGDPKDVLFLKFPTTELAQQFHAAIDWTKMELHIEDRPYFPETVYVDWDAIVEPPSKPRINTTSYGAAIIRSGNKSLVTFTKGITTLSYGTRFPPEYLAVFPKALIELAQDFLLYAETNAPKPEN